MRVTILGSGGSTGVPGVGLGWGKCDPDNPKNRRSRPSILVEDGDTTVLVDTSPDLREQLIRHDVTHLDGVLLTHTHADHVHGIDDLRGINRVMQSPLDLYTDETSLKDVKARFGYVLEPIPPKPDGSPPSYFRPVLTPHTIAPGDSFTIGTINIQVLDQDHGFSKTLGFRFGDLAYSTDVKTMPEASFNALEGVGRWIIGAPITFDHPTHIDVSPALEWIERINPDGAILSHLGPALDYETLRKDLPDRVEPAYDGMVIDANEL
jgi:phosphoribosyl 1,2-cyclic phosphate phosphodiesterase